MSPTEAIRAYQAGELDFAIADPALSSELIYLRGGRKIATLKTRGPDGGVTPQCGGVIFCRNDNRSIAVASDLKGVSFAAVDQKSLGGWLAAARELQEIGIAVGDFEIVDFLGSHEKVVHAVLGGSHQAGTVQTDILETMAADGKIDLGQLRILSLHTGDGVVDFPYRISTRLYPERPVLAATHTPQDLVDQVSAALLLMPEDSEAARAIGSGGWTLPAKYKPVLECLIELDVEPYGRLFKPSRRQFFKMYMPWIVGVIAVIFVGLAAAVVIGRRNQEMQRAQIELQAELDRRLVSEEAMAASERKYRQFFENSPDPVFLADRNRLVTEINEAFLREGSFQRGEVVGKRLGDRVHPDDLEAVMGLIGRVLGGTTSRGEWRVKDVHGVYRWFSVVIWPVWGKEEAVVGFEGIARNVDQRRKDEIQFRQLSAAIEQAPVAVVITDAEGVIEYVNPAFTETTGYSEEEALGQNPRILKSDHQPESFYTELWTTITEGNVWRGEFCNRKKSGELYWERAAIAPVRDEHGDIVRYVAVKENLTKLRETERALRDSEELFKTVIETAQDSIFVKDRDLTYRLVNPAMARDLRRTSEEISGLTDFDLFGLEEGQEIRKIDERVLRGETVEVVSSSIVTGEERSFAVSRVPLRNQDGEIDGVCGIARDITERERQKEDLKEAKSLAEAATEAKSLFTASISHELRTPLNGVVGMIDLLLQTDLDPEQRQYVRIAGASAQSLTELVGEVLDFSRIEAGKIELNRTNFAVRSWLVETVEIVIERARVKGLDLKWSVGPDVPELIWGDQYRLQQILFNLIGNAVKFTKEGSITVGIGLASGEEQNGALDFSVQDTGVGIPKAKLGAIFEVFSLADENTTRSVGGTGLGLAISRDLVEKMGGRIWVESEPGVGSTFRFTLPQRTRPEAIEDVRGDRAREASSRSLRVLVVDDNPVNRLVAARTAIKCGHSVTEAENGRVTLEILARGEIFDVVLMDLHMPMIDGLEATKEIRQGEGGDQHLWIIGLTAAATTQDREACLAAGMDDYLSKPVRFDDLQAALARAVIRSGLVVDRS
ncbi:MAG: hypothetical protein DRJ61_08720 [Acidobacteria bacterium]|nr:MAG: hypothetical protein DRJ61_08720 [Acidobacteriota bacterium]